MSNKEKEVKEAIAAGERALVSLRAAQEQLNSARSWGIFDMFGGGFIASMAKHSKMDGAKQYMEDAKYHLSVFQRELKDVNVTAELRMDVGGFLSFADFFMDGLVADYLVQSKIAEAREQVDDAIVRVSNILTALKTTV